MSVLQVGPGRALHNRKSRAHRSAILYNRIMDETGGVAYMIGNLVQKGPRAENRTLVAYGAESLGLPRNELYVVNNTLVNDRREGRRLPLAWRKELFVRVWGKPARVRIVGNLCVGPGLVLKGAGELADNLQYRDRGACAAPAGPR